MVVVDAGVVVVMVDVFEDELEEDVVFVVFVDDVEVCVVDVGALIDVVLDKDVVFEVNVACVFGVVVFAVAFLVSITLLLDVDVAGVDTHSYTNTF